MRLSGLLRSMNCSDLLVYVMISGIRAELESKPGAVATSRPLPQPFNNCT